MLYIKERIVVLNAELYAVDQILNYLRDALSGDPLETSPENYNN